jgi:hypothetical protein
MPSARHTHGAWPWHFQAAANVLTEAGIPVPHDCKVAVQMVGWDSPCMVRADAIDRDVVLKQARDWDAVDHDLVVKWRRDGSTCGFVRLGA